MASQFVRFTKCQARLAADVGMQAGHSDRSEQVTRRLAALFVT